MGIQDLQLYIQTMAPGAAVSVDLLRIARNKKSQPGRKLKLVLDAECCLDRLYGGYFSDWASGGQWNRMVQFLSILCQHLAVSGIELVVFFNGSLETGRVGQWAAQQQTTRQNVAAVFRHLSSKGTPPPKVWWVPPMCLRTSLRMALRHLNIAVICSMDDHKQEVIAYCRENNFHGLLVEDAEYAAFDPPRYFSSENLKLTYKGSLETKEYLLARVAETLQIPTTRLPLLAALLGTHLLGEDELADFFRRVCPEHPTGKIPPEVLIKGVAGFIKGLGASADDIDQVAAQVFGGPAVGGCEAGRAGRLRSATQYYLNGTKEGFLKYKAPNKGARNNQKGKGKNKTDSSKPAEPETTLKFASETAESERDSLAAYKEATANSTQLNPEIVVEPPGAMGESRDTDAHSSLVNEGFMTPGVTNGVSSLHLSNSSSSSNSNAASPSHNPSPQQGESMVWSPAQPPQPKIEEMTGEARMASLVSAEVLRTAAERHQKGLMTPSIYQILTQGVIKLPAVLEDEQHKEFPSAHHFYRPVRQMVYGILFNLHHLTYIQNHKDGKEDQQPQPQQPMPDPESIVIREWVWSKSNQYARPEVVKPEKVGWGVPTIQRLWFGSTIDDKRRRLRAFLSCMRSDTPLMLNPTHVPQPMLIFACVIRYMMSFPDKRILRKHELDALIAQAHAPELMNATYLQDLQLPRLSSRGVQLATLLMTGVENALLANDACGAPIPWLMCCPWLFFDGKLFQHKLLKAETCKNLVELCDHRIDEVIKVERMRQAILEGLNPQFARMPLMPMQGPTHPMRGGSGLGMQAMTMLPSGGPMMGSQSMRGPNGARGVGQSRPQRTVLARGGQLEVAGVVVGSWGPNYGSMRGNNQASGYQTSGFQGNKGGYQMLSGVPAGLAPSLMNPMYCTNNPHARNIRGGVNKQQRLHGRGRSTGGSSSLQQQQQQGRRNNNHRGGVRKNEKETKGRGTTVQLNGTTVLATDLVNGNCSPGTTNKTEASNNMLEIGQFEDAATGSSLASPAALAKAQ